MNFYSLLTFFFFFITTASSAIIGQWDFDDSNAITKATVGKPLELEGNHQHFNRSSSPQDGAVRIGIDSYYKCTHELSNHKIYSIAFDIRVSSIDRWSALFQTDTSNASDAELFFRGVTTKGSVGSAAFDDYSSTTITPNIWHSLIVTVNLEGQNSAKIYLNGSEIHSTNQADPSRLDLPFEELLFFADNSDEDGEVDISKITIYDKYLSPNEVLGLVEINQTEGLEHINTKSGTIQFTAQNPKMLSNLKWTVSDDKVATINEEGLLQAKKNGYVNVRLSADGSESDFYSVSIKNQDSPKQDSLYKVLTYNIWENFKGEKEQTISWLKQESFDVVALQELHGYNSSTFNQLATQWDHPHSAIINRSNYALGITSKYPIEVIEKVVGNPYRFGYLHVIINKINYVVVHITWQDFNEGRAVRDKINAIKQQEGAQVIVLGDYNSYSSLDSAWLNTRTGIYPMPEDPSNYLNLTYDIMNYIHQGAKLVDILRTHDTISQVSWPIKRTRWSDIGARIDYILTDSLTASYSVNSTILQGHRFKTQSDHYPVVSVFDFSEPDTISPSDSLDPESILLDQTKHLRILVNLHASQISVEGTHAKIKHISLIDLQGKTLSTSYQKKFIDVTSSKIKTLQIYFLKITFQSGHTIHKKILLSAF